MDSISPDAYVNISLFYREMLNFSRRDFGDFRRNDLIHRAAYVGSLLIV